ncbi:MAG TPA: hypothetical protein VEL07_17125 [Planctomycetota bacterium]|nr:hypothetical protein [Planctomycetota bacterium]
MRRWWIPLLMIAPLGCAEQLVATNGGRHESSDAQGFRWDRNGQTGAIDDGTNDCFDSGLWLTVNGQQFQCQQPMMTADGELVLSLPMGGITVTRRVRVLTDLAAVRWCEIIENTTDQAATVAVMVEANLGGNAQATVTTTGQAFGGGTLGAKDVGFVTQQPANNSRPSVLFVVQGPRSKNAPAITIQQNRRYGMTWSLALKPRSKAVLVHLAAQRRAGFDAAADAAALLKALPRAGAIPRDLMRHVVNLRLGAGGADAPVADLPSLTRWCERTGVERVGEDLLVVASGAEDHAIGVASGSSVVVEGAHGRHQIAFEEIAAVAAGVDAFDPGAVYTRQGEVLRGRLAAADLVLASTAGALAVDVRRVRGLALRAAPDDGIPADAVVVGLRDGDVLALARLPAGGIDLIGAFGRLTLPLPQVSSIERLGDGAPGWRVVLRDGTSLRGMLGGPSLTLPTRRAGDVACAPHEIVCWYQGGARPADTDACDHAELAGGDRVAGVFAAALSLATASGDVGVEPARMRSLEREDDGEVAVELAGDTRLSGRLRDESIAIARGDGSTVRVPARLLVAWRVKPDEPEPVAAPTTDPRLEKPVTLSVEAVELKVIGESIAGLTGLPVEIAADVDGTQTRTLSISERPLHELLDLLVRDAQLSYRLDGGTLRIEALKLDDEMEMPE